MPDNAGLVTICNDWGQPSITVWRCDFERLAPVSIEAVERAITPTKIRQGNVIPNVTLEILDVLTEAHRETPGYRSG